MTRWAAIAMLTVVALMLAGCGPIYSTEYRYTPPAGEQARFCVAQCMNTRELCRISAEQRAALRAAECRSEADRTYAQCLASAGTDEARSRCRPRTASCSSSVQSERCDADYRVCYQTCGGKVESQQVCTFNCR
ncbi:MAG: hypothetical protein ACK4IT_03100 [Thioalkalivibrionaceae bacterium]